MFRRAPITAVLAISPAALAQPPLAPEAGERLPVEPAAVLRTIRGAYHDRAVSEEIEVRFRAGGQDRTERIGLVLLPGARCSLDLGQTFAWFEAGALRIVHALDERAFFQADAGPDGPLPLLEATLPPLPVPQLWLGLTPPGEQLRSLTKYARSIRWTGAELRDTGREQLALLRGEADRSVLEIEADPSSGRLRRVSFTLDQGSARIDLTVTNRPIDASAPIGRDVSRRERVNTLEELRPRIGDLRIGDVLPEMILPGALEADGVAHIQGPGVIVLFRRWGSPAASAAEAARRFTAADPRRVFWPVFVIDPIEPRALGRTVDVRSAVGGGAVFKSLSPATTIDRFAEQASCVSVAIDSRGVIRLIETLERTGPGSSNADDLSAAPDAAIVDRLVESLRTALAD